MPLWVQFYDHCTEILVSISLLQPCFSTCNITLWAALLVMNHSVYACGIRCGMIFVELLLCSCLVLIYVHCVNRTRCVWPKWETWMKMRSWSLSKNVRTMCWLSRKSERIMPKSSRPANGKVRYQKNLARAHLVLLLAQCTRAMTLHSRYICHMIHSRWALFTSQQYTRLGCSARIVATIATPSG